MTATLARALDHLLSLQRGPGCWEGEMVWCPMISAQYVIVRAIAGPSLDGTTGDGLVRYFRGTRTAEGGWGLHPESGAYVFVTTLAYVALRLLGLGPEDPLTAPARQWLRAQPGGVLAIPTWGKLWLALVGLYDYRGINPCPPELFLLPAWLPVHPSRYYCHTRYIYLALAYLYGRRATHDLGPITADLRRELYAEPYEAIDWARQRHRLAPGDLCVRPGPGLRRLYDALAVYERVHSRHLRARALEHCLARILYEQRASRYQAISPVNGLLDCLALRQASPDHPDLRPSLEGVEAWRWADEAGIRYAGARSQTWDTAFAVQALLEWPAAAARAAEPLRRAYRFLDGAQMTEELPGLRGERRDPILGGWCFSDGRHRWPVSDCTAEALTAILGLHARPGLVPAAARIAEGRLRKAAEFILSRQNADGGFGTYERRRGSPLLDRVNPSEMFRDCMTERSYVECTASALGALARFRASDPGRLEPRLSAALERGIRFLRAAQRPDGAYAGFWGVNVTYAIFHVVEGMTAAGLPRDDPTLGRAAEWLAHAQRPDGGWGERHPGCGDPAYVERAESQAVMTAWALLALLKLRGPEAEAVRRGVAWLSARQAADGGWPREGVNGVFFGSAMLDYRLYTSYFPVRALARYAAMAGR